MSVELSKIDDIVYQNFYCVNRKDSAQSSLNDWETIQSNLPQFSLTPDFPLSLQSVVKQLLTQFPKSFADITSFKNLQDIIDYTQKNNLDFKVSIDVSKNLQNLQSEADGTIQQRECPPEETPFVVDHNDISNLQKQCQPPQKEDFVLTKKDIDSLCKNLSDFVPKLPKAPNITNTTEDAKNAATSLQTQLNTLLQSVLPNFDSGLKCAGDCSTQIQTIINKSNADVADYINALSLFTEAEQQYYYYSILFAYSEERYLIFNKFKDVLEPIQNKIISDRQEIKNLEGQRKGILGTDDLSNLATLLAGLTASKRKQVEEINTRLDILNNDLNNLERQRQSVKDSETVLHDPKYSSESAANQNPSVGISTLKEEFLRISQLSYDFSNRLEFSQNDLLISYSINPDNVNKPSVGTLRQYYTEASTFPTDLENFKNVDFVTERKTEMEARKKILVEDVVESVSTEFRSYGSREALFLNRFVFLDDRLVDDEERKANSNEISLISSTIGSVDNGYVFIKNLYSQKKSDYDNLKIIISNIEDSISKTESQMTALDCCQKTPLELKSDLKNKEDFNDNGFAVEGEPDSSSIHYWQAVANNLTLYSVSNPLTWSVGLLIPTPSGILKTPLPTVWKALGVITLPYGLWVVFLCINGILPCPVVFEINYSDNATAMIRFGLRSQQKKLTGLLATDSKIISKSLDIPINTIKSNTDLKEGVNCSDIERLFLSHPKGLDVKKSLLDLAISQSKNPSSFSSSFLPVWTNPPKFIDETTVTEFASNLKAKESQSRPFVREDLPRWVRIPKSTPFAYPPFLFFVDRLCSTAKEVNGFPPTPPSFLPFFG